jgi:hypothetical protein
MVIDFDEPGDRYIAKLPLRVSSPGAIIAAAGLQCGMSASNLSGCS